MKVLWFTNTPSLAASKLALDSIVVGGWIESLEKHIKQKESIELGVAFMWKEGDSLSQMEIDGTRYYLIPNPIKGKWKRYKSRVMASIEPESLLQTFLEVVEDFQPDLIHIFGTEYPYGLIIPHIDIPIAIWIQGNLTVYTQKWFSGLSRDLLIKKTPLQYRLKAIGPLNKYQRAINVAKREKEIFSNCKYFTGRTEWDRRLTRVLAPDAEYFHCDEVLREDFYKHTWIPHGEREKYLVLSTISPVLYKGLETVWETMKLLPALLNKQIEWRIAGIDDSDFIVKLVKKVYGSTSSDLNIRLLGKLNSNLLIEELLYCDLFVHPSHIDNSPNSVCEAMILGIPIVTTSTGGTSSLLTDQKEGILIQDGDCYSMTGAILEMLQHPDVASKMGSQARLRAVERHNPQRIVGELEIIYSQMMRKKPTAKAV